MLVDVTRCLSLDAYKIGIDGMSLVVSASSANQDLMRPNLMLYGIPDDWIERYQEQMYSAIDPVIQHCLKTGKRLGNTSITPPSSSPQFSN